MYDRGIEAFLAIASCHSISGAAKLLYITQSAVSHRLRELEDQLGMILIDRQKGIRRSELTLAGEKFYPLAEQWNRLWHETKQAKSGMTALSLKIGTIDSVNTYVLPPLYRALVSNTPSIYLQIFSMRSVELYDKIEKRELDVAFVLQRQRCRHMNVVPFYREPMHVVGVRQKRNKSLKAKPENLNPAYELFINWGPSYQIWHDNIWDPLHKPKIELDSVFLIQALLEDPKHWAIVPKTVADQLRKRLGVAVQQLVPPAPDRTTYMITHQFPRMGAREGIETLHALAGQLGFFNQEKPHISKKGEK